MAVTTCPSMGFQCRTVLKAATGSGPTLGAVASVVMSVPRRGGVRGCTTAAMALSRAMVSDFYDPVYQL
jgi:hypothetical protein